MPLFTSKYFTHEHIHSSLVISYILTACFMICYYLYTFNEKLIPASIFSNIILIYLTSCITINNAFTSSKRVHEILTTFNIMTLLASGLFADIYLMILPIIYTIISVHDLLS